MHNGASHKSLKTKSAFPAKNSWTERFLCEKQGHSRQMSEVSARTTSARSIACSISRLQMSPAERRCVSSHASNFVARSFCRRLCQINLIQEDLEALLMQYLVQMQDPNAIPHGNERGIARLRLPRRLPAGTSPSLRF